MLNRILIIIACSALAACAQFTEHRTGIDNNSLTSCPAWPRCVNSLASDAEKKVAPFQLKTPLEANWQNVMAVVARQERTQLVDRTANYLHAEITSPWGWYTDDLELLLDVESGRIDVRSSGRIGYYDFNVNRDRVEALREALLAEGLINQVKN